MCWRLTEQSLKNWTRIEAIIIVIILLGLGGIHGYIMELYRQWVHHHKVQMLLSSMCFNRKRFIFRYNKNHRRIECRTTLPHEKLETINLYFGAETIAIDAHYMRIVRFTKIYDMSYLRRNKLEKYSNLFDVFGWCFLGLFVRPSPHNSQACVWVCVYSVYISTSLIHSLLAFDPMCIYL